ncbi:MAG: tyrosine-protein phosphatase [Chloroflexota bacterium]|nr:tyrosine-protein phosphatase [Chloroflexota bacterium]
MTTDERQLHWDACLNVRDLGGFPTRDGHTTRSHAIIRADNLCRLTRHGRLALVRYGARTAIDLRDPKEHLLEYDPFSREELADVGRVDIPQLTPEFWRVWDGDMSGHEGDLLTLETCREPIAAMFAAVAAAPEGGIVIFCHAGKERTGIAAALLLEFAGVDRGTIGREHALSDDHLAPLYAAWLEAEADPEKRRRFSQTLWSQPDQMRLTLDALDELYGGIGRYLLDSGAEAPDLALVRERILE